MRTNTVVAVALTLALASPAGPVAAAAYAPAAAAKVVHIAGFAFKPHVLRIRAGERVRFLNDDDDAHTVTATDRSFDSEGLGGGQSWDHVFTKAGTYTYFCELHPGMKATIEVRG